MDHALAWILKYGGGIAFIIIIAWPCLALPAGVFSKGYFTFWVIISIIWGLVRPSLGPPQAISVRLWDCLGAHSRLCCRPCAPFRFWDIRFVCTLV